jgi:CubicO group peptidase (beta-lactamase class C family)
VSAAWIATASQEHTLMDGQWKYGYLWWLKPEPFHGRQVMMQFAWGNGGQYIFVIPEADLVVVFTGENYDSAQAELPIRIVEQDILPSIE